MKYKKLFLYYFIFFSGLGSAFGLGYLTRAIHDTSSEPIFPVLEQAYRILKNSAYNELPPQKTFEYAMIHRMMETYNDPYSRFEEPALHELNTDQLDGKYGGIGASLESSQNGYLILHPFSDGPADNAGIIDGDILNQIDDWQVPIYADLNTVLASIRGPEGEPVIISITRPSENINLSFKIVRRDYPIPSVSWYQVANYPWLGILQINLIAGTTVDEIKKGIDDLNSRGSTHFAIDLRNNRGGLLSAGIEITRLFLENGVIIQEQYRNQEITTYSVNKPGPFTNIPLVVFVDHETASAAEIIAGAFKVHERAIIIGIPTFGKDSIQLIFDLMDDSSLHVTAAKWWIPGLETAIGEGGIKPDIDINTNSNDQDPYVQSAIQVLTLQE